MSKKLNVQCYECKTVYELEPEMVGETVECAVCGAVFVIPDTTPDVETDIVETNSQAIAGKQKTPGGEEEDASEEAPPTTSSTKLSTKTIKLNMSRGHGMIPRVDDKFGIDKAHHPKHLEKSIDILKNFEKSQAKSAKKAPASKSHWWQLGSKKKK